MMNSVFKKILNKSLYIIVIFLIGIIDQTTSVFNATDTQNCLIELNGKTIGKKLGDTWISISDPCERHVCEYDEINGNRMTEKIYREYCHVTCNKEYELFTKEGECCGECIQTKCELNGTIHKIGDIWKSTDKCTFYECTTNFNINVYKKDCHIEYNVLKNCPVEQIWEEDCCPICRRTQQQQENDIIIAKDNNSEQSTSYTYDLELNDIIMDRQTYINHPCSRDCLTDGPPMICNYTFLIEWYETLSKACYNCPFNQSDCYRPHCIFADGHRRSILVINRMMPGPLLSVCYGDTIIVDVINNLMGESTAIHWHGLHQRDSPYMDGVPQVTQCPILPHTTFRYTIKADRIGTHWWHSHIGMQRTDGAFGALIIKEPKSNLMYGDLYDLDLSEHIMFIQDWDHRTGSDIFNSFHHSIGNNKPKNILINGKGKYYEPTEINTLINNHTVTISATTMSASSSTMQVNTEKPFTNKIPSSQSFLDIDLEFKTKLMETTTTTPSTSLPDDVDLHQGDSDRPIKLLKTIIEGDDFIDASSSMLKQGTTPTFNYTVDVNKIDLLGIQPSDDKQKKREPNLFELIPYEIYEVIQGNRYRFRIINAGFLNCPIEIAVYNHNITVIASDGWYVEPVIVSSLVVYAGERFDFILNADQSIENYWMHARGLMDCDERFTKAHQLAILHYRGAPPPNVESAVRQPPLYEQKVDGIQLNALNKGTGLVDSVSIAELTASDPDEPALIQPLTDYKFYIYYDFYESDNPHFNVPNLYALNSVPNKNNQFFGPQLNHITMKMPSVPLLLNSEQNDEMDDNNGQICNETMLADKQIDCKVNFCECTHVIQIPLNSTVELIFIDEGHKYDANHPFHLHGYGFRVIGMERIQATGVTVEKIKALDESGKLVRRLKGAPIKDTITIPDGGYTIVRFIANNPGYWLLHCHIEFHIEVGMALVFKVGHHNQMKSIPKHFPTCSNYIPMLNEQQANKSSTCYTYNLMLVNVVLIIISLNIF